MRYPDRSMRSYLESLGFTVTSADGVPEYIEACLEQRRGSGDETLEAEPVVSYVREGFGLEPLVGR